MIQTRIDDIEMDFNCHRLVLVLLTNIHQKTLDNTTQFNDLHIVGAQGLQASIYV